MTMAAAGHVVGHSVASSAANTPSGIHNDESEYILMLLAASAVLIFIDRDRSGKGQDGDQYIALGIVGGGLLLLGTFWPSGALAFAILFFVSIVLNTPNGIPFVTSGKQSYAPGTPDKPGQLGYGAAIVPVNQQTGVPQ